jgi:membrane associated rhomboid family serine protease
MEREMKLYAMWLSVFMVAVFILQSVVPGLTEVFVLNSGALTGDVWRFVSAVFLHGGLGHLVYNLFALLLFGGILESQIGSRKFLWVFLITGILANIFSVGFYPSSLGASGAIFGVIGALVVLRPGMTVWAFGMPMPMLLAGVLWAGGDVLGAVAFFSGNPISNTGNLAHLSGMFFGVLGGFWFRGLRESARRREGVSVRIDERSMRRWEDQFLG